MGALAFLPWEKWAARLLHALAIAIRRLLYKMRRRRSIARSAGWPETEATVERLNWDVSLPREEVAYSYAIDRDVYAGHHWLWFDSPNDPQPHVGDKVLVRFRRDNPAESCFPKT
jgi:hypothetical protein